MLIRENLGGFYVAHEFYIPQGNDPHAAAVCTGMNTREGSERIARFAFEYAVRHGRKKITVVHKANILKALTGLFLEACKHVAKEYEGRVEVDDMIVDACAMQLVLNPWRFDMLLCTNLFGDILSDQLAGWSAAWAWRRARTSAGMPPSSRRCTARRPTSRAGRGQSDFADAGRRHDAGACRPGRRRPAAEAGHLRHHQHRQGGHARPGGTAGTRQFAEAVCRRL